jgi:hypothetical protein
MRRAAILASLAAAVLAPPAPAAVTQQIRLDNFGYRPDSPKVAVFTADPGATVQVRRLDGALAFTVPTDGGSISARGFDSHSGDTVWWVDFTPLSSPGDYRLHSAALGGESYPFTIAASVYDPVVRTALRTFYLQRCNTPKLAAHAGAWADPVACHTADAATGPEAGHGDHGPRDLTGGWHDAGDYNKYMWGDAATPVLLLLRSWEANPHAFGDQLGIPESGNGFPDVLDEVRWELEWMRRMQLPGGAVLSRMHVTGFDSDSPPSADPNPRYYHDPTVGSAAVAVGAFSVGARVFAAAGDAGYAATLESAALASWTWLLGQPDCAHGSGDCNLKVWAAAELFRLDGTQSAARAYVDAYWPGAWNGRFFNVMAYDSHAALSYVRAAGATAGVVANMRQSIGDQVDYVFQSDDAYRNGMPDWSYHWGSSSMRAGYGIFLLEAAALDETGSHTAEQCRRRAEEHLHYFHGQNPLGMVYLSNMAALGGEHSAFQIYHAWFGDSWRQQSRDAFLGKPAAVVEPAYPYFAGTDNHGVDDADVSTLGPAPGFVPGGPNRHYGGSSMPPRTQGGDPSCAPINRCYRDWNEQRFGTWPATWEISENSIAYQGAYVALGSWFVTGGTIFEDGFEGGSTAAWGGTR